MKQSVFYPDPVPIDFDKTLNLDVLYTHAQPDTKLQTSDEHTVSLPVFVKRHPHSAVSNACYNGFVENGTCYYAYALRSVCLKVKQGQDEDHLTLDNTYGGVGCSPGDPQLSLDGAGLWPGAKYRFIQLGVNETNVTSHMIDLSSMEVSIRSGRDPIIYANNITDGTLNFISFGNRTPYISLTRGFIGFGSVGMGAIFFLPSILCCIVFCCRSKTRYLLIDNMREEHHMLLKLTTEKQSASHNWSEYLFPSSAYGTRDVGAARAGKKR
jgi:hypothetical protein